MPIGAVATGCIEIVQQHKFLGELVLIGRDVAPEHHQRRIAVALRDVAEHLVVGAILFDDKDYVIDGGRVAGALRDRHRAGFGSASRRRSSARQLHPVVLGHRGSVTRELSGIGDREHGDGAAVGMHIPLTGRVPPPRTDAQQGRHGKPFSVGARSQTVGIPGGRNQSAERARIGIQHRDGVDAPAGHVQGLAIGRERQRGGRDSRSFHRERLDRECLDNGAPFGIDH